MDREKQVEEIDELTTVLYEANHKKSVLDYRWLATEAYNAGYRKESKNYIGTDEVLRSIDYRPVEEVRKETAKEILSDIDFNLKISDATKEPKSNDYYNVVGWIEEIAK